MRKHAHSWIVALAAALLAPVSVVPAQAEEVERVIARLTEEAIWLGDSTRLEIRVVGVREAEPPPASAFPASVDAQFVGSSASSRQEIRTVGGQIQVEEHVAYVIAFDVRPRVPGRVEIPALPIHVDGERHETQPVALNVIGPEPSDFAALELSVSDAEPVVEQPIDVVLTVHLPRLRLSGTWLDGDPWFPRTPPAIRAPWVDGVPGFHVEDTERFYQSLVARRGANGLLLNGRSDRSSLFSEYLLRFELPREEEIRGGGSWYRYTLRRTLTPTETGTFELPIATLRGTIVTGVEERRGSAVASAEERVFVATEPVTLTVRPIPTEGRPPSYVHAVGRYEVDASLGVEAAQVGDPVPLVLVVRGEGLTENVRPPRLAEQTALNELVAVDDGRAQTDEETGERRFEYTLRPRRPGELELPPIEFPYYDPATGEFATARSAPLRLRVEASAAVTASDVIRTTSAEGGSTLGDERQGAVLANSPTSALMAPHRAPGPSPWTWVLVVLAPAAYAGALWHTRRRGSRDEARERSERALERARTTLAEPASASADELHAAVAGFVADRLGLAGQALTAAEVKSELAAAGVSDAILAEVETWLQALDHSRYAGGTEPAGGTSAALELLERLDGELRR